MSDDVQALDGFLAISFARAADTVGVIDRLATLCRPKVLTSNIVAYRADLIDALTRVNARNDASTEVVTGQPVLALVPEVLIDPETAAAMLKTITADGVRWLCRHGRLAATKVGGRWWIDPVSVDQYRQSRGPADGDRDSEPALRRSRR